MSAKTRHLAALTFANVTDDPVQEDFSAGLTEGTTTDLAPISSLLVIAPSSPALSTMRRAVDQAQEGSTFAPECD